MTCRFMRTFTKEEIHEDGRLKFWGQPITRGIFARLFFKMRTFLEADLVYCETICESKPIKVLAGVPSVGIIKNQGL